MRGWLDVGFGNASETSPSHRAAKDHVVHFYENHETLVRTVERFLADGIASGEACVVIATEAHRRAFSGALKLRGVDVERCRSSEQLTLLDARQTLDEFVIDGAPVWELFHARVGNAIEARRHRPDARIRLYGEMVDLLWRAGNPRAALELEEYWNSIAKRQRLSLLCGYVMRSFERADDTQAFRQVINQHSRVLDAGVATGGSAEARSRELAVLRQRASALEHELRQRRELEIAREAGSRRTERLMRITAAIAEAVSEEQVLEAVVDRTASALGASSAGLWVVSEDGERAQLVRHVGYPEVISRRLAAVPLDTEASFPALDALRGKVPIFIGSRAELVAGYQHLASMLPPGQSHAVGCLPVTVEGKTIGSLAFTFDGAPPIDAEGRNLLSLVAAYSGQALERLRLLDAERKSRADSQRARLRAELLHGLARAIIGAERVEQVFEAALDAIGRALDTQRASVRVIDTDGAMRLKAWRGLSDEYRSAAESYSPWTLDADTPRPLVVPDVGAAAFLTNYLPLLQKENIGALGFIPLLAGARLVGYFVVYFEERRTLQPSELETALTVGSHVAAALERFRAVEELRETVRFNEVFTGVLGHDLRNPLGAIMTAAELALRREESDRLVKPLSRILTSGRRMARMIDQLLDFTRVRVGAGIPLVTRPLELSSVVRQITDELEDAHPQCVFSLECTGDTKGVWDEDRLSQVFSNLVANAVEHGQAEHGVWVRIDGTRVEEVRVEVHNMGRIPSEVLPRLFEPILGMASRHARSQGLGLGLFISREILKAHGARIDVHSTEDGTIFTVCLPRARSPSVRASPQ